MHNTSITSIFTFCIRWIVATNDSSHWIKIHLRHYSAQASPWVMSVNSKGFKHFLYFFDTPVIGRHLVIGYFPSVYFPHLVQDICSSGIIQTAGLWPRLLSASEQLNVTTEGLEHSASLWLYSLFTGFQEVPELLTGDPFEQFDWFCPS